MFYERIEYDSCTKPVHELIEKINNGKKGQKINIYDSFINTIDDNPNYLVGDRKPDGSFSLIKKQNTI